MVRGAAHVRKSVKNLKGHSVLDWAVMLMRLVLAGVFLYACAYKIYEPHAFAVSVYRYQLLPSAAINLTAIYLPWLELAAALAILFAPRYVAASAAILFVMLGVFAGAIGYNVVRGVNVACGCFSGGGEAAAAGWGNVARNLGLMVLCAVVLWYELQPAPPAPAPSGKRKRKKR
jgi:hypothetical protein